MTKSKVIRAIAAVMVVCALVMAVVGAINLPKRNTQTGQEIIQALRIENLLDTTGVGLVETYVDIAKKEARTTAIANLKAEGKKVDMKVVGPAVEEAEALARAQYAEAGVQPATDDTTALAAAVEAYAEKLDAYYQLRAEAQQKYVDENMAAAQAKAEAERQAKIDAGEEVGEEKVVTVELSGFDSLVAAVNEVKAEGIDAAVEVTERLLAAKTEVDKAYDALAQALKSTCAPLTDAAVSSARADFEKAVKAGGAIGVAYQAEMPASAKTETATAEIAEALNAYAAARQAYNACVDVLETAQAPAQAAAAAQTASEKAAAALASAQTAAEEAFAAYLVQQTTYTEGGDIAAVQTANELYLEKQAAYEAAVAAADEAAEAAAAAQNAAADAQAAVEAAQAEADAALAAADAAYAQVKEAVIAGCAVVEVDSVDALRAKLDKAIDGGKTPVISYKVVVKNEAGETGVDAAVAAYVQKQQAFNEVDAEAKAAYTAAGMDKLLKQRPEAQNELAKLPGVMARTQEINAALAAADTEFNNVGDELKKVYPAMDNSALKTLKPTIQDVILQQGEGYTQLYDRYIAADCRDALSKPGSAALIRYADDLIYGALALVVAAAIVLFYETLSKKLGIPRIVLGVFFILLCFMCLWFDLSLATLLSNSLVRMGMNAVMVLAMVPGIQCGISLNLGLPIGLVAGLIGGLCTIEWGIPGVAGFVVAVLVGCVIAAVAGWLYAHLLNRLKGEEMSVTTYVGFSIVSLMCIAWLVLPFKSLKLRWPMGTGLRNTIGLDSTNFKHVLDDFLSFEIGDFTVPTGLLLFMLLMCFLVWLFTRSKTGVAMSAVGNNPRFAEATGINVDKMRVIGTVLSTVLGAIGILVYSQSYGFMQLYTAPRQMGFIAASAILIGGASTSRCKISHVLIGTFLFQGVLTLGMPVANVLVPGSTISETLRILISNGIILYALTKSGGESRA